MIHHRKLRDSFIYAWQGVMFAFRHNQNLRIHFVVAVLVSILAVIFRLDGFEMGILGITILFVLSTEMVNSAIEEMVDLITTEHRQEAKIAKDVAAGMVLLASVGSVIIGFLIFAPHIEELFRR